MSGCDGCDPDNPGGHLPPPRCLDLGGGEVMVYGTAADFREAADYLRRHYPDGPAESCPGSLFAGPLMMTWTKLGDEFSDEARDLTDAEVRTHIDALNWSNRRGLDLHVPKRDLRRFAESQAADEAVAGLLAKDWWKDRGDAWYIGVRFPEWQLERAVIDKRREAAAQRKRRQRLHQAGDHSLCIPDGPCPYVTRDRTRDETRDPVRFGSGTTYPPEPLEDQDQNQRSGSHRVGGEADDKTGSGLERSAANSQKPRVHHGPESPSSDDQQIPDPELTRAQPPRRNARARCPQCGRDSRVMPNGFLMSHGPADPLTRIRACHHVRAAP